MSKKNATRPPRGKQSKRSRPLVQLAAVQFGAYAYGETSQEACEMFPVVLHELRERIKADGYGDMVAPELPDGAVGFKNHDHRVIFQFVPAGWYTDSGQYVVRRKYVVRVDALAFKVDHATDHAKSRGRNTRKGAPRARH